jgi:preprotein translocase subunit SecG
VYTFLTILHVIVCIFLMLVVLLQAGRGGGIGLAFGGSGGSQSVFGSSGGATFLTKLTAICAIIFFTNSLALAYMSSQSDSRRLQKIAEKKAQAKKAEDAANAKMLTEIEKQREAKAKTEAEKSEAPTGATTETEDKAPAADDKAPPADDKAAEGKPAATGLKLKLPAATTPGGKLAPELKLEVTDKPAADKKTTEKPAKPAAKKPAADKSGAPAEKPAAKRPAAEGDEEKPAAE